MYPDHGLSPYRLNSSALRKSVKAPRTIKKAKKSGRPRKSERASFADVCCQECVDEKEIVAEAERAWGDGRSLGDALV